MRKILYLFAFVVLIAGSCFAQNECRTQFPNYNVVSQSRDANGVQHDTTCLNPSDGNIWFTTIAHAGGSSCFGNSVTLVHNGVSATGCTPFTASADTDVARGTALFAAYSAAVDGDSIVVPCLNGGKIFDLGTNHLDLSLGSTGKTLNLTSQGCNPDQAVIKCAYITGNGQGCVTPGTSNSYIGYVTIWGFTADESVQAHWVEPFGIGTLDTVQPSNVIVDHVHIRGTNDGLIWFNAVTASITFFDSVIDCDYDCVSFGIPNGTGAGTATGFMRFYNTRWNITGSSTNLGNCNGIKTSTSEVHLEYVISVYEGHIIMKNGTGTCNLAAGANSNGVTVNLYSGVIDTSGASGAFKSVAQSGSGVLNVYPNFGYDHTKTQGTISQAGQPGFTPISTADFSLGGNWGTSPSVSAASGYDRAFNVTVTSGSGVANANPTLTLTFHGGAMSGVAPAFACNRSDNNTPLSPYINIGSVTTTSLLMTFVGTPSASTAYSISCVAMYIN